MYWSLDNQRSNDSFPCLQKELNSILGEDSQIRCNISAWSDLIVICTTSFWNCCDMFECHVVAHTKIFQVDGYWLPLPERFISVGRQTTKASWKRIQVYPGSSKCFIIVSESLSSLRFVTRNKAGRPDGVRSSTLSLLSKWNKLCLGYFDPKNTKILQYKKMGFGVAYPIYISIYRLKLEHWSSALPKRVNPANRYGLKW